MNIKELRIARQEYGEDKGKLMGQLKVDSQEGAITINLTHEHAQKVIAMCADSLVVVSKEVANEMTAELLEQSSVPLIEA